MKQAADESITDSLADALQVDKVLAGLLADRGVKTFEEARDFFRPSLDKLHDPFTMKDMDKAVVRIEKAFSRKEKILVYGDYDVDGTTAVALVYDFLSALHPDTGFYIPDRYSEGYGISFKGIDYAAEQGYSLLIALDCGIKANDKIAYALEKGIDFIICDHHLPGDTLPKAEAVLDPKRSDCPYPYKELSGCGIGFKLLQALSLKGHLSIESLYRRLELVAVSIAADIVPITGENRILAWHGLKQANAQPSEALKAMLKVSGKKFPLTISDLVFIISPRINAAGRIESGHKAVELLLSKHEEEATTNSKLLDQHNTSRKNLDKEITQQALALIEENQVLQQRKSTVLFREDWHKGVIGIVASRVMEVYYRPTILLTESGGKLTGSARSVKDFDIHEAIGACAELLEQYGGHKYAAGLTLQKDRLEAFCEKFEAVVAATITDESLVPKIEIDAALPLSHLRLSPGESLPRFFRILKQFGPFGPGNMNPLFLARKVKDAGQARTVGENHLKLCLYDDLDSSVKLDAIAFGMGEHLTRIQQGEPFHIIYALDENLWQNRVSLQLMIKDIFWE